MNYKNWRIQMEQISRHVMSDDQSKHSGDDYKRSEKDKTFVALYKAPIACAYRQPDQMFPDGLFLSSEGSSPDEALSKIQKEIDKKEEDIEIIIAKRGSKR